MKLDAKVTFKQAQRKQEGPWTTDPIEMNQKFIGVISTSTGQSHWGTCFYRTLSGMDQYEILGTPIPLPSYILCPELPLKGCP